MNNAPRCRHRRWPLAPLLLAALLGGCERQEKTVDHLGLAKFYLEQGNDEQALGLLVGEIDAGRNLAEAHRLAGDILLASGSFGQAIEQFSRGLEQGCGEPCAAGLTDAYLGEGEGELAAAAFARSALDRDGARARYQQIMIDYLGGVDLEQTLERLAGLDSARALDRITLLLLEQQRYPEILAAYRADEEYSETRLLGLAASHYALGNYREAEEMLLQARRISPGKLITRNKILAAELLVRVNIALNKIADAERIYQAFLDNYRHSGYVALRNSLALLEDARYGEAIGEIRELAQYQPDNPDVARLLASASAGMRNHQGVVNAIGRFADELDDASKLLLADAYLHLGRPQDTLDLLDGVAAGHPARLLRAQAQLARGDADGARATLEGIDPPSANAERMRLADLWLALGRPRAVIDAFAALDDTSPAVRHSVLRAFLALDRAADARAWAERQADPVFGAELRAMIELETGNPDAAVAVYESLLAAHGHKRYRVLLAMTHLRRRDNAAALAQLRAALAMPGDNRAPLNLAAGLLERGDDPAIVAWLDSIAPDHPDYRTIQLLLANQDTLRGRYQQAQRRLAPYAEDSDPFIFRLRARALSAEDPEGAWRLMERSLDAGFSLDTAARLARYYLQRRDRDNLARIVAQIENLAGVNLRTARVLSAAYLFLERYPAALALADELVRQGHEAGGRELRADTLRRQGEHARAAAIYRELFAAGNREPLLVKALTAAIAADDAARANALVEAERVLAERADWHALRYFAAMQYVDRDNQSADRHFRLLVEHYPDDAILLNNLAWANLERDPAAAVRFAASALELDRDNDDFLDTYARALRNAGDADGARRLLARRLDSSPDNPGLRELLQSLN